MPWSWRYRRLGRPGSYNCGYEHERGEADSRTLQPSLREKGITFIDAPVARMRQAAKDGTLSIMVGGSDESFRLVQPFLPLHGDRSDPLRRYPGSGQVVKIQNNMIVFMTVHALAEAPVDRPEGGCRWRTVVRRDVEGIGGQLRATDAGTKGAGSRKFSGEYLPDRLRDQGYQAGSRIGATRWHRREIRGADRGAPREIQQCRFQPQLLSRIHQSDRRQLQIARSTPDGTCASIEAR